MTEDETGVNDQIRDVSSNLPRHGDRKVDALVRVLGWASLWQRFEICSFSDSPRRKLFVCHVAYQFPTLLLRL